METLDIYHINLDADGAPVSLPPEEERKYEKILNPVKSRRLKTARKVLRYLLSVYLEEKPEEIVFRYNGKGKPSAGGVHFNISHSEAVCLMAFGGRSDIGIDVEVLDGKRDCLKTAARCFSANDLIRLRSLPPDSLSEGFFRIWCTREAAAKTAGISIWNLPGDLEYGGSPLSPPAIGNPQPYSGWFFREIKTADGFFAVVASETPPGKIREFYIRDGKTAVRKTDTDSPGN